MKTRGKEQGICGEGLLDSREDGTGLSASAIRRERRVSLQGAHRRCGGNPWGGLGGARCGNLSLLRRVSMHGEAQCGVQGRSTVE